MDPSFIKPFVTSIQNVFSTMLQLDVTVAEPAIKAEDTPSHDVSGIIAMSGDAIGSVVLSFPYDTAEDVVGLFCGERLEPTSADFADAIGELVNMVTGNAKAQFPDNRRVSISTPNVVVGTGHTVARRSDIPCIAIPCTTDCGEFVIEIGVQVQSAPVENTAAASKAD